MPSRSGSGSDRVSETRSIRVGSVVVDCVSFDHTVAFWRSALYYEPREEPRGGWVVLRAPEGAVPNVSLRKVSRKTPGRNNLHVDLYCLDREKEELRLLKLGARRHRQKYTDDDDFRVLEDPDGDLFCVVQLQRASR